MQRVCQNNYSHSAFFLEKQVSICNSSCKKLDLKNNAINFIGMCNWNYANSSTPQPHSKYLYVCCH